VGFYTPETGREKDSKERSIEMLKRLFNWIKKLKTLNEDDLVKEVLENAREEIHILHQENRERAIKAITERNILEQQVIILENVISDIEKRLKQAKLEHGETDIEEQVCQEIADNQVLLKDLQVQLQKAIALVEEIKAYI
jgi:hypothetical protein